MEQSFSKWESWLEAKPTEVRNLVYEIARLIFRLDVKFYCRMSYGVPFIYRSGPFCYFNADKEGVYIGFFWGKLLHDPSEILDKDQRKLVKILRISSTEKLNDLEDELTALLLCALDIDQMKYGKKKMGWK